MKTNQIQNSQNYSKTCKDHHGQDFIALCTTCKIGLCIDCIFDHQKFKTHHYEKLENLKKNWITQLQNVLTALNDQKSKQTSHQKNKIKTQTIDSVKSLQQIEQIFTDNLSKIENIKSGIIDFIEKHFEELKENYKTVISEYIARFQGQEDKQASKLTEFQKYYDQLNDSKKSQGVDLLELLKVLEDDNFTKKCQSIINQENGSEGDGQADVQTNDDMIPPEININDLSLQKLQDIVRMSVSLSHQPQVCKKMFKMHLPENKSQSWLLPWFIENTNNLLIYDIRQKKVIKYNLKSYQVPFNHRVVVRNHFNSIYVIGGQSPESSQILSDFMLFDQKNSVMRKKSNLKQARIGIAVCYIQFNQQQQQINEQNLNDTIFAIGGKSDKERLSSVEKYNFSTDSWTVCSKMQVARSGATACYQNDNDTIYVFGGLQESNEISYQIEMYSISQNRWLLLEIKNESNYLATVDSASIFINSNNLMLLGGARTDENDIYFTNLKYFYNVNDNVVLENSNVVEDFPNHFLGDWIVVYEKVIYMLVKLRRENKTYGPFQKILLTYDLNKNSWKFDQLLKIYHSENI